MKIGRILARLREEAGLSQKQLGKKIGASTSGVSRMESDLTPLNEEEINNYISGLGTNSAKELKAYRKQEWVHLTKPDFFHPSRKTLWEAEESLKKLVALQKDLDINSVFFSQLKLHDDTVKGLAAYLLSTEHTIACIGSIGVGKTTAICGLLNLKHDKKSVLHTGGGRSTVCEVQIQQGPEYGITIEPLSDDETYKYVYDFCDYLLALTSEKEDNKKFIDTENFILSKEIERCIRNIANLPIKRFKTESGFKQDDYAVNLVKELRQIGNRSDNEISDDLKIQVIMRMNLENRKKTELWYPNHLSENPLEWLKKNYRAINHGLHSDFSIPKKITINLPSPILSHQNLKLKIIDTKGVDYTAKREDLELHINDPRAIAVFCSRFLDAPDETTKTLIERAIASGIKDRISSETAILVLPRNNEAISVNTLDGAPIEDRQEGYLVRFEDIQSDLMKYDLRDLPVSFYDEMVESLDETDEARKFIVSRVEGLRQIYENRVREVAKTIKKVEENIDDAKAKAAFSSVLRSIDAWIQEHKEIKPIGEIHKALVDTIEERKTHAGSVRASVNRSGSWYNLDYYYHIGFGTRTEAVKSISGMISELNTIIKNLQSRPDLETAHEFLQELVHFCNSETEKLYQGIQKFGQEIYKHKMVECSGLWGSLQEEWGKGPGYKLRVSGKTESWFENQDQARLHAIIQNRIAAIWKETISKFEDLVKGIFG
jgi:transcriptional regulator with XRE-family HTH domain